MKQFNKATAAAISSAVTGLLVALTDLPADAVASVGVLVTTLLVYFVPNSASPSPAPRHGGGGGP